MGDHKKLSPSSSHRWMACPASVAECAKYPERPSGKGAIDGTHTHSVLEWSIKNGMMNPMVGSDMTDHEGSFTIDDERAERVRFALNFIQVRCTELGVYQVLSEEAVDPQRLVGRDDMGGTVDVQIIGLNTLDVIDYKDGMNAVEAKDNTQLLQYAIGAMAKRDPEFKRFQTIGLHIIQPKSRLTGGAGTSSWIITPAQLQDYITKVKAAAAATDDPNAPFVPGEKQCQYCAANGKCMALVNQSLERAGIVFEDLSQGAADKNPSAMSDEQLRELVEASALIRQMLDGAEAEALRRFEVGHPVAGLKVVRGRGSRSWALEDDLMADKLKRMGVPKSILFKTSLITVAQALKAKWETKSRAGEVTVEQLSPRQLKTLENEFISHGEGRMIVVSESDNRPAITVVAAHAFEPVVEVPTLPSWLN
jgi:hypothetical protein